jgi:hypothetical protein
MTGTSPQHRRALPRHPPELGKSARRRAANLLDEATSLPTLWVVNSSLSDVMHETPSGPSVDHSNEFDWLLVLGSERLGLVHVPAFGGPRRGTLTAQSGYDGLKVDIQDVGALARRRLFLLRLDNGEWIALGAPIHKYRRQHLDQFTRTLCERASAPLPPAVTEDEPPR